MTLYLSWNDTESRIDVGQTNTSLINGDWTYHDTHFENSDEDSSPSFSMTNFTYNGTEYMTSSGPLIPFNQSPYAIMFGTDYLETYKQFALAFMA